MTAEPGVSETVPPVRHSTREETDRADYWNQVYSESENHTPGWDLGIPNPELQWQLDHADPRITPGRILVPGCGYGHDLLELARRGFSVTGVDMAPMAVAGARARVQAAGLQAEVVEADLFQLPADFRGRFDCLYEYTCFCAIHPERRREYAQVAASVLRKDGQLIGCFYHHGNPGGPPFDTTPEAVRAAFRGLFDMRTLVVAQHSVERRQGKELWARFWRL